ncbi:MAG: TIGR04282 family arsenosugar biosynthesis glycosyltransferase [Gammaproteobacteria bacterium]|nr:TIGR04282 family arsenosugar biosynthesis glycosyltransferase [Gammaproteobacteria bacterium]
MKFPDTRLIVFAKAPEAGRAKTRLIPALGKTGAAALHARLVTHTLTTVSNAALCPVQLWCAPNAAHPFFDSCKNNFPVTLHQQQGANLGERMAHAMNHNLQQGFNNIIIGTDCPALSGADFEQAFTHLQNGSDIVLSPASDGGYVLMGLTRFSPTLFSDINWGSGEVLAATRERIAALQWPSTELKTFQDIDRPEDLNEAERLLGPIEKLTSA